MMTVSDGKVYNKAEALATAKATKYVSVEYEDIKVTVFGDTAIATGGFKAKGTDASGKPLDVHERCPIPPTPICNQCWKCSHKLGKCPVCGQE